MAAPQLREGDVLVRLGSEREKNSRVSPVTEIDLIAMAFFFSPLFFEGGLFFASQARYGRTGLYLLVPYNSNALGLGLGPIGTRGILVH